jgi:hypothetical protein
MKPTVDKTGNPVQVDGSLIVAFETRIEDPPPELSDAEIRQLAITTVEPKWPVGSVKSGETIQAEVSVNEQGQLTGSAYPHSTTSVAAIMSMNDALRKWTFRPLIRNGKPQYFHGVVKFIVP